MKIKLNPFLQAVRGKMGNTVFRLCHTGELQIVTRPDMKKVKWSEAQKEHRLKFRDAVHYAKVCMRLPELRAYYLEMAQKRGKKRPFDEAVHDYFQGNNLIFDSRRRQAIIEEQDRKNSTPAIDSAGQTLPLSAQRKRVALNEQNRPQRAGFASSSSTKTLPACAGEPATMDDRWITASLVMSDSMYETGSIACCFGYANP